MNEKLKIEHMNKSFPVESGTLEVLNDITLTVQNGEFISIVGYSGCGKSTLLRIVGGLEIKDSGIFQVEGKNINGPGLDRGMIFQESRLFPWLKVCSGFLFSRSTLVLLLFCFFSYLCTLFLLQKIFHFFQISAFFKLNFCRIEH